MAEAIRSGPSPIASNMSSVNQVRHLLSSVLDRFLGPLTEDVRPAASVPRWPDVPIVHRRKHARVERRRGVVVEVFRRHGFRPA